MVSTWLLSLLLRDASIVDIIWGAGFVLTALVTFAVADGTDARRWLLALMTTLWGGRLALYLLWRNAGKGEDPRYQAMRRHWGDRFWIVSLGTVFLLRVSGVALLERSITKRRPGYEDYIARTNAFFLGPPKS